jgi:hypothetical protein
MANRDKIKQKHSKNRKEPFRKTIYKKHNGDFNFEDEDFVGRKERQIARAEKKKKNKERGREKRRIEGDDE